MLERNKAKSSCSQIFSWNPKEFNLLLDSCNRDDGVILTSKYLKDKKLKILEAGCGLGRVVKYFYDKGFNDIQGIELNKDAVNHLNKNFPELNIIHGDVLNMPYQKEFFDMVLSYGVIEHFPDGPSAPMKSMYEALRPGGVAIITVPSFNFIRQIKYYLSSFDLRKKKFMRKLFGKKEFHLNKKRFSYYIEPQIGDFFEYRFTPKQFENICKKSGFDIVESKPIAHIDGLFHIFGSSLVEFKDWQFRVNKLGKFVNKVLTMIPFSHNHMHACVVRKPENNR